MLFCVAAAVLVQAQSPNGSEPLRIDLGNGSFVEINAPHFVVERNTTQADGRKYLLASNESKRMTLSMTVERVSGVATQDDCRAGLRRRTKPGGPFQFTEISESQIGDMAVAEYMVPEANGMPVRQKNLLGCLAKGNVYVDIHLSQTVFDTKDLATLQTILSSARFSEVPTGGEASAALFLEGSQYFRAEKFDKAIAPYQKALDHEKAERTLDDTKWRILIDNLAMAYGVTGNLDAAEGVVKYGLSKAPEYPMFYFLLADSSAERGNLEDTLKYLRLALKYRQNVIPGETLPDPLADDSFKRFWRNEEFKKLAAEFR